MFTGLVEAVGTVERAEERSGTVELWVRSNLPPAELKLGESIAHNGVCLTVVELGASSFRVQVSEETLRKSTLSRWKAGESLNLERALKLGDRLGGHLVLGHVDGVGRLLERRAVGGSERMRFSFPPEMAPLFIEKGSITIDGTSLTINALGASDFEVMVIPETLRRTTLAALRIGDEVNLEGDVIGKYVARLRGLELSTGASGSLSEEALRKAGFE